LDGQNGKVSKKNVTQNFNTVERFRVRAFNELKDNLIAQIELVQPDYNKKFTLTIGAVLSQEGKPITFISKTLTKAEQIYATNKKEL